MCEPKENKCVLDFICMDEHADCYQYSPKGAYQLCKHSEVVEDFNIKCSSKIANINAAVIYLKSNIGDKNTINLLLDQILEIAELSESDTISIKRIKSKLYSKPPKEQESA